MVDAWAGPAVAELAALALAGPTRLGATRLITVDGPSGSGKTTLAGRLLTELLVGGAAAALVRTDHFATWDEPFGWWPALESGVLQPVATGRPAGYVANDWSSGEPRPTVPIAFAAPAVLILEGVSAARRTVEDRTTLAVWVAHLDRRARLERAVARDGEQIRDQLRKWQDAEDAWFAADDTRARADAVISTS